MYVQINLTNLINIKTVGSFIQSEYYIYTNKTDQYKDNNMIIKAK